MTRLYLCARSLMHAHNTAIIDWGWQRKGDYKWTNKLGEEVCYLWTAQNLNGVRDCVLYLGFGWFDNPDLHSSVLRDVARNRNITLIDGNEFQRCEHIRAWGE